MTVSPHLPLGSDALSREAKLGVVPVEKPERRKKGPKGLARSGSKPRKTPLGHCTEAQKARVAELACLICKNWAGSCQGAHVIPRGHPKMTREAADDVRAVVPLCGVCHRLVDEGHIDLLAYLEPAWRDSQEWAAGAVGLATAMRAITGARLRAVSDDGEMG